MEEAAELDTLYPNISRNEFHIPTFRSMGIDPPEGNTLEDDVAYLCGNSLGLMPKSTKDAIKNELNAWRDRGVEAHFNHPTTTPWVDIDLPVVPLMSDIVGGKEKEVAIMNTLTSNLNTLLVSFYKPNRKKFKIIIEKTAFPSDYYALLNQCYLNNYDPEESLIQLKPRKNEVHLRIEDIKEVIQANKDSIALVCLPGIQYYTGQLFDIEEITCYIKTIDPEIIVCWDLAHAVGNVPLQLHDWNVDIAVWCTYKYLNSGPGCIGGIFIHNKYIGQKLNKVAQFQPRLAGWWGNDSSKRFDMKEHFEPIEGALGFRQSNPSVIDVVSLQNSLKVFQKYGTMKDISKRSNLLTNYMIKLLTNSKYNFENGSKKLGFKIITPINNDNDYGAQISLYFYDDTNEIMSKIFQHLHQHGVIVDERKPNVIRIAPAPLYNTFKEVYYTIKILDSAFETLL